jgi:hypothetical protein
MPPPEGTIARPQDSGCHGGRETILRRGSFGYSPVPGTQPTYT